jgi:hypothetical protein
MALEPPAELLTADELRDAVPTDLVPANRFIVEPAELDPLLAPLAGEAESEEPPAAAVDVDVDEPPELELSPPPPPPPPPPSDLPPPPRPPPPRLTETVMEVESPVLLKPTDKSCRCPTI